jgi:Signal transduction histidine kinase
MSEMDIPAGARWGAEVDTQLQETNFAILCVTRENAQVPWMLFEAGAVAKAVNESNVCPYLIDLRPSELPQGPLTRFQAKEADRNGTWEIVRSANARLVVGRLTEVELTTVFDRWWPDLEEILATKTRQADAPTPSPRSPESIAVETLDLVRELSRRSVFGSIPVSASLDTPAWKELIATLRHESLSVLDGILVNAEWLSRLLSGDKRIDGASRLLAGRRAEDIQLEAMTLTFQLDRLNDIHRPAADLKEVDINESLKRLLAWLRPAANRENVDLAFRAEGRLAAKADPSGLMRVFYNISNNALKYRDRKEAHPYIAIRAGRVDLQIAIEIEDNGVGIENHDVAHIFEATFRSRTAAATSPMGAGLGLTAARHVMRLQGGDIVVSRSGKPTIFKVLIPTC